MSFFSRFTTTRSFSTQQCLVMLLLVLQVGFINAESLWMAPVQSGHHHVLDGTELSVQEQQSSADHCDICHGNGAHLALFPLAPTASPVVYPTAAKTPPKNLYLSTSINAIYRPPITASI